MGDEISRRAKERSFNQHQQTFRGILIFTHTHTGAMHVHAVCTVCRDRLTSEETVFTHFKLDILSLSQQTFTCCSFFYLNPPPVKTAASGSMEMLMLF